MKTLSHRKNPVQIAVCTLVFAASLLAFLQPHVLRGQVQPSQEALTHVKAGLEAREQKRYQEAAHELEAAVKLAPQVAEIYLNLGLVYHEQGQWAPAVWSFEKALELKPEVEGVRGLLGFDLIKLGRIESAVDHLERAHQESPTPQVSAWLGLAYLKSGRHPEAIPKLEFALDKQPGDIDLLYYLAQAYGAVSANLYAALLEGAPDSARAHMAIAEDHAINGRRDEAIRGFRRVLERDANLPGVHEALGDLYRETSRYEDAASHYEQELKITPADAVVHYRYGSVLLQLGRSEQAVVHLKRAIAEAPGMVAAYAELGKAHFDEGSLDEAKTSLLRVLELTPTLQQSMSAHYQLGQILTRQGHGEQAAGHLQQFRTLRGRLLRAERAKEQVASAP